MLYCVNAIRIGNLIIRRNAQCIAFRRSILCCNCKCNKVSKVNNLSLGEICSSNFYDGGACCHDIHFYGGDGRSDSARRVGQNSSSVDWNGYNEVFIAQGNSCISACYGKRCGLDYSASISGGSSNSCSSYSYSRRYSGGGLNSGFIRVGACPRHSLRSLAWRYSH